MEALFSAEVLPEPWLDDGGLSSVALTDHHDPPVP